ncbi:MAG TPA: DUF4157 domain-containing protein [Methylocella sp.]|nr:DUF4157 domain-containing protein [Methylocella sp.]
MRGSPRRLGDAHASPQLVGDRGGAADQPQCAECECEEEEKKKLQMKPEAASPASPVGEAPLIVHEVLRQPGEPLDAATRSFFEPRFGHDFSQVCVHTGTAAHQSARDVNALAYTIGQDIVFDEGRFARRTREGRRLLAHELTHVAQQDRGHQPGISTISDAPRILQRQPPPVTAPGSPGFTGARGTAGEQGMAFAGYRRERRLGIPGMPWR